jgi:hypothetical protein
MTLVPHNLPDYVELGGRQVWRPPYTARHAEVFGFAVKADRAAIDGLLGDALVEPAGGAVDYRCAHDHIMVTFAKIDRLASADPPDSGRGYMPEREVTVWCLAADVASTGRLVWYLPYVFTDSGQTVATGREVYGYPKQIGYFEDDYPKKLLTGGESTVFALGIDPFHPDQAARPLPMISAMRKMLTMGMAEQPVIATSESAGFTMFDEVTNAFPGDIQVDTALPFGPGPEPSAAITPIGAPPPPGPPPSHPWVRRALSILQGVGLAGDSTELIIDMVKNPTLVFLKQFRDVECPTKACYQAVVEAPLDVRAMGAHYQALDPDHFELTIHDWASHPIATDLGVVNPLKPQRAFRAQFDFDIMLGQEVWRAPT